VTAIGNRIRQESCLSQASSLPPGLIVWAFSEPGGRAPSFSVQEPLFGQLAKRRGTDTSGR